jgi:hypothetical protein
MRSTAYDAHIYEDTYFEYPQLPWELNIGDGHFATCPSFFTPIQATNGHVLTVLETTWNDWIQLVRSRVEHINMAIKNHRMFKGEPYRGYVRNLRVFVKVLCHGAAAHLRADEAATGPRFNGYGPWAHAARLKGPCAGAVGG